MTKPLNETNVLVVGGGTGIGLGIAQAFDREGARVAISGRRQEKLDEGIKGSKMIAKSCDASERDQVAELLEWFGKEVGVLDIFVFSAGINVPKRTFADMDPEDFEEFADFLRGRAEE